jgi:hypothetical protein
MSFGGLFRGANNASAEGLGNPRQVAQVLIG